MNLSTTPTELRLPAYRRIAEGLRNQIAQGEFAPGARLPSTDDLAVTWKSTNFTVHAALTTLVKEGWINRQNGTGTFVAPRQHLFRCAGIYHGTDIWADENRQFTRNVHQALVRKLREKGRTMENFTDPRPPSDTTDLLPTMKEAIEHRRIDCLIAVTTDRTMLPVFDELKVPTACIAQRLTRHRVCFDEAEMLNLAAEALAEQGCRTAGVITSVVEKKPLPRRGFTEFFRQALRRRGIVLRDKWILQPSAPTDDFVPLGYEKFREFWALPDKPDGLFVYPDLVVRGVITAALQCGPAAHEGYPFVMHRNAHTQVLCPFPATWIISEEDLVADALIAMIERQFDGQPALPVEVKHTVRHEPFLLR
jgi:DNA-binding transcriptional regulator YhcF (GntR family)